MSKILSPLDAVAVQCKERMDADLANKIVALSILAVTYLEKKAQESVNLDGAVIAEQVKKQENVDAESIFYSHKDKVKASKTIKALTSMVEFGQLVMENEQKAKAIETTKSDTKELPAPAAK